MITLSELFYFALIADQAEDVTQEECTQAARRALAIEYVFQKEKDAFNCSDAGIDKILSEEADHPPLPPYPVLEQLAFSFQKQ